jgi:hypothetical protein
MEGGNERPCGATPRNGLQQQTQANVGSLFARLEEDLWVTWEAVTETLDVVEDLMDVNFTVTHLEALEEVEDLTSTNLTPVNLETLKEFEDLTAVNLMDANIEPLKDIKDLTTAQFTAVILVLQSHVRSVERRQVISKEEPEGHNESNMADAVKLK